jgi:hypothetical protein
LGSGNVSALNSNSALQNLLVMATSRAGNLSYADMLIKGVSSSQANELLYNVINYIREIASTDNNVVRSQFAQLFGVSISDMAALGKIQ